MQSATQSALANLVEDHITSLIRESAVVNRHSKRGGVVSAGLAEDENLAWRAVGVMTRTGGLGCAAGMKHGIQYGLTVTPSRPRQRRRLIHHDDVNMALCWRGSEKLYVTGIPPMMVEHFDDYDKKGDGRDRDGVSSGGNISGNMREGLRATPSKIKVTNPKALKHLLSNTTGKGCAVPSLIQSSVVPRIDLNAYVQSECAIRPPCELGMTVHWLAINGVSPSIPMNDVWNRPNVNLVEKEEELAVAGEGGTGKESKDLQTLRAKDIVPLIESSISTDLYDEEDDNAASSNAENTNSSIRIRELQRRLLSEELQLYYARVTTTIESSDNFSEIASALHGIRTDGGIQELVPFLSRFVSMGLSSKHNLRRTEMCRKLVRVFDALLDNANLHLDLHLHQMFTPVGTCIVAKKLSSSPYDDHWSLREEAARCVVKACDIYGDQYTTMKPRVIKLLTQQALRIDRPLPTQYGGIVGISLFGPRAIDAFILPLARTYWEQWEEELSAVASRGGDVRREYELHMCQQALLSAIGIFMQKVNTREQAKRIDIESFVDVFGERLIIMQPEPTDYLMAIF